MADHAPVGQLEVMQVRQIPTREGSIDRLRQLLKRVRRPNDEDPPRRRLTLDPAAAKQVYSDS